MVHKGCIAALAALALTACSRPEPPTLTPLSAAVTSISPAGLGVQVKLEAFNPNSIEIPARSVSAKTTLDGRFDLGTVTMAHALTLPPKQRTEMTVPLSLKWTDLAGVVSLVASNRDVPFRVEGKVALGGESLRVDVPFRIDGTISHQQLVQATRNALPQFPGTGAR